MNKWVFHEGEDIEFVLDKIWNLHDKFSDTILSISRHHFTKSRHSHFNHNFKSKSSPLKNGGSHSHSHFSRDSSIAEAKSLDSIRSALEHLEDQLEFFHTVQIQQRTERDAALARLEQSRIILALKLAEHSGKRYKVIDEAMDFVGDVRNANCFVGPEQFSNSNLQASAPIEQRGINSNVLARVILSTFGAAKRTLQLDRMGGVLGNAALFGFSILALLHLHQATCKDDEVLEFGPKHDRSGKKSSPLDGSSGWQLNHLDVRSARG